MLIEKVDTKTGVNIIEEIGFEYVEMERDMGLNNDYILNLYEADCTYAGHEGFLYLKSVYQNCWTSMYEVHIIEDEEAERIISEWEKELEKEYA